LHKRNAKIHCTVVDVTQHQIYFVMYSTHGLENKFPQKEDVQNLVHTKCGGRI